MKNWDEWRLKLFFLSLFFNTFSLFFSLMRKENPKIAFEFSLFFFHEAISSLSLCVALATQKWIDFSLLFFLFFASPHTKNSFCGLNFNFTSFYFPFVIASLGKILIFSTFSTYFLDLPLGASLRTAEK